MMTVYDPDPRRMVDRLLSEIRVSIQVSWLMLASLATIFAALACRPLLFLMSNFEWAIWGVAWGIGIYFTVREVRSMSRLRRLRREACWLRW